MSARSHWILTSSITPSYCPSSTAAKALWSCVLETTAPCVGVNYRRPSPLPAPVAFRYSSERPLHEHGWQRRTKLCLYGQISHLFKMWGSVSFRVQCECQKSCGQLYHIHSKGELDASVARYYDCGICSETSYWEKMMAWCFQILMDILCATASCLAAAYSKRLHRHYLCELLLKKSFVHLMTLCQLVRNKM